jgi:hypothetical protein
MPRKLAQKKEGDRMGRPRTGRTQFTIRLDPDASAILKDAGSLYRICELIGLANYEELDQAVPAPGKVLEMMAKQHVEEWMRETLARLSISGLPEAVSERLRQKFRHYWPTNRETSTDKTDY